PRDDTEPPAAATSPRGGGDPDGSCPGLRQCRRGDGGCAGRADGRSRRGGAAVSCLAAADARALAAESQAECLRGLERAEAVLTAGRASFLSAFTAGKGYAAAADYSARVWLVHK